MPTARILIKQDADIFRFLRFESSSDGSVLVFLDRDPRPSDGDMVLNEDGIFVPEISNSGLARKSARYSIHTTGEVHRYEYGERKNTIYIEPLYKLTHLHCIGIISIPHIARLDSYDAVSYNSEKSVDAILYFPGDFHDRLSFCIEIGPKTQYLNTFGVVLNYEIYAIIVRTISIEAVPNNVSDHFICGMPKFGAFPYRQVDKATAELEFYRLSHPGVPPVFREPDGRYVAHAAVPMRTPPRLVIEFDRSDLQAEQIKFDYNTQPSHKVRFWIRDKGGRNRKDDLRKHIILIILDARL